MYEKMLDAFNFSNSNANIILWHTLPKKIAIIIIIDIISSGYSLGKMILRRQSTPAIVPVQPAYRFLTNLSEFMRPIA